MNSTWKQVAKLLLVGGILVLVGLIVTSCLTSIFNQPPKPAIAIADGSPYGPPPLTVTFDISGSSDPDGEIVSFTLEFADGSEAVKGSDLTQLVTHTYLETGQYFATLTVVDNAGKEALAKALISVFEAAE